MVRIEFVWQSNENISSFKLKRLVKDFIACAILDIFKRILLMKFISLMCTKTLIST